MSSICDTCFYSDILDMTGNAICTIKGSTQKCHTRFCKNYKEKSRSIKVKNEKEREDCDVIKDNLVWYTHVGTHIDSEINENRKIMDEFFIEKNKIGNNIYILKENYNNLKNREEENNKKIKALEAIIKDMEDDG